MSKKIMTEDTMQASAETTAIATKNNHEEKFKEDVIEAIQERVDKNVETIASREIVYTAHKERKRTPPPIRRESWHATGRVCFKYWIGVYRAIRDDG